MGVISSQITSLTIVYLTVYSDADHRKHQSSTSLAFVRGIHRGPVNSPHKWPVTWKMFPFDDVIMWGWVTNICISNPGYHCFRKWPVACTVPSHYLNQCWNIVNWTPRNKLQWTLNWNSYIFIQENACENVVWTMAAILSRPQCVKKRLWICCQLSLKYSKSTSHGSPKDMQAMDVHLWVHRLIFLFYISMGQCKKDVTALAMELRLSCTNLSIWSCNDSWGLQCQKQLSRAWISNYIPQYSVGCNYLSMP